MYLAPCEVIKMLIFCFMILIAHTIQITTGRNVKFNKYHLFKYYTLFESNTRTHQRYNNTEIKQKNYPIAHFIHSE